MQPNAPKSLRALASRVASSPQASALRLQIAAHTLSALRVAALRVSRSARIRHSCSSASNRRAFRLSDLRARRGSRLEARLRLSPHASSHPCAVTSQSKCEKRNLAFRKQKSNARTISDAASAVNPALRGRRLVGLLVSCAYIAFQLRNRVTVRIRYRLDSIPSPAAQLRTAPDQRHSKKDFQ